MKSIPVEQAVGHVLAHDITRIIKDLEKGPVFKKGHVIREEDIPVLLDVGKKNIYILEKTEDMLHEDEAAAILRDITIGNNMTASEPSEGKIELKATCDGLFKVNFKALIELNSLGEISVASRHGNIPVKAGEVLAGMRVIPLIISKEKMELAKKTKRVFDIAPYEHKKCAIIATGSEVFTGRIKDTFTPVVEGKLNEFGGDIIFKTISDDKKEAICDAIDEALAKGADIICVTGGMSVDPDDLTPASIRSRCDEVVTYGAPVLPGAMFMLGYKDKGTAIMGLPGCVMFAGRTIFDLVLPRIFAGEKVKPDEIYALGEGGLCLKCPTCIYPNCGFGKGHL